MDVTLSNITFMNMSESLPFWSIDDYGSVNMVMMKVSVVWASWLMGNF